VSQTPKHLAAFADALISIYTFAFLDPVFCEDVVSMNANQFLPAHGRPQGANPAGSATREQPPGQGERSNSVVRVTAADVLSPANLQPPTAQTFDELQIPASFRAAVEQQLTSGEKMLWLGRPSRNPQVHTRSPILAWIGGALLILAIVIVVANLVSVVASRPIRVGGGQVFFCTFAGFLGLIGLAFLILPRLNKPAQMCRSCYVVTNRRAMLLEESMLQRTPVVHSYLPQQLLGMERQDHATVAGAGDLVFEYVFALPGNTVNPLTGSFHQQNPSAGLSNAPQRLPRGFMLLDQVRDVEDLIRTTFLLQLEQALDAPKAAAANGGAPRPIQAVWVGCTCGATIEAPAAFAGKSVKCPRCAAAVAIPTRDADASAVPVSCREDSPVPAELKGKTLAGLDANEKPVWIGQPVPKLILLRSSGYFAGSAIGILAALIWLVVVLALPTPAAGRSQPGQPATTAAASTSPIAVLLPIGLLFVSVCVSAVPLLRWHTATRTCYALTNRRAVVYKQGLFGTTRESYTPLEVSNMRRSDSWLTAGSGDLIFRTVQVVTTSQTRPGKFSSSVKTIHYGFLAIAHLGEVEKIVRETLIDRFVDKLTQASALA
jgi:hypothetical protein